MRYLEKAPWLAAGGVFFMLSVAALSGSENAPRRDTATFEPSLQNNPTRDTYCRLKGSAEAVSVQRIYDGDTLLLEDGRKLRLLGVNTPEMGNGKQPAQAFARAAKQAVENFFADGQQVWIQTDVQLLDRHGRLLAHVFKGESLASGENLEQSLLRQGLAWHVAVPPNLQLAACLASTEDKARHERRGLWARYEPTLLAGKRLTAGGYQRIRARVGKVVFAKAWWINFSDDFAAVIYPENQKYFSRRQVAGWEGQWLELEGWVYPMRYKNRSQWRVKLETPYAVTPVP